MAPTSSENADREQSSDSGKNKSDLSHRQDDPQKPVIALAGNPNSGKTTLFNALTGLRYKVANYPGVTVDKKRGSIELPTLGESVLVDLPGIYSLAGSSLDEQIAIQVLLGELKGERRPDCVIVAVDASNLERNLFLASQLLDLGLPVVVALTMVDLAEKRGLSIHNVLLSKKLGVPVVPIVAQRAVGLDQLKQAVATALKTAPLESNRYRWLQAASDSAIEGYKQIVEKLGQAALKEHPAFSGNPVALGAGLLSESFVSNQLSQEIEQARESVRSLGVDPLSFEAQLRYSWINEIVLKSSSWDQARHSASAEWIDSLTTHRIWGTLAFLLLMSFIFQSIFLWAEVPMGWIEAATTFVGDAVGGVLAEGLVKSLVVEGIIAGVGNVVIFVPQIALLFFFLGLLEDSGYLARAAFLMDRVMRPFGLQGRSFIPLLSSFACAIPGILSARTIPSWTDRLATILIAPLMSCSARLPVYAVLIGACIPATHFFGIFSLQGFVLLAMYLLGIIGAAFVALALKITLLKGDPALFVMEMPALRRPSMRTIFVEVVDRVKAFLVSAGTTIFACSIVLWFLASFPTPPESYTGNRVEYSFAGRIGKTMEPVIEPLGFNWQIGVGVLASFAAREVFVSALSTVYNLETTESETNSLLELLKTRNQDGSFSTLTAISLMVFYVFACQCISTLAVCKRETGSWWWTGFMFFYMTLLAYVAALVVFQGGKFMGYS